MEDPPVAVTLRFMREVNTMAVLARLRENGSLIVSEIARLLASLDRRSLEYWTSCRAKVWWSTWRPCVQAAVQEDLHRRYACVQRQAT